jgi:hypothetical protein
MKRALFLCVLVTLVGAGAGVARADGDPASDWLITKDAFIPPDAGVPVAYSNQLGAVLADAKARGFEVRVALIASKYDLGSVPVLYGEPQRYAPFLSQEDRFIYRGRILTVMPNGLGFARNGQTVPAATAVLRRIPAPGKSGAAMASAATHAVIQLAAQSGVVVPLPPLSGSTATSSSSHDRLIIIVAVVAVALVAGAVWFVRRPTRTARGSAY